MNRVVRLLCVLIATAMGVAVGTGPVHADTVWSRAVVDLSDQRVYIYDTAGTLVREWPVSTGAAATPTPTGRFRVESRSRSTFVRDNPSVTMAYMVRFNRGVGFHAIPRQNGTPLPTPLGERGVSHGCVRLADRHAAALYRNLTSDAVVVVRR